MTYIRLCLTFF